MFYVSCPGSIHTHIYIYYNTYIHTHTCKLIQKFVVNSSCQFSIFRNSKGPKIPNKQRDNVQLHSCGSQNCQCHGPLNAFFTGTDCCSHCHSRLLHRNCRHVRQNEDSSLPFAAYKNSTIRSWKN